MLSARDFRLYKRAYNYKKAVSIGPNIEKIFPENTYQSLCRLSTTLISFQGLAEINRYKGVK